MLGTCMLSTIFDIKNERLFNRESKSLNNNYNRTTVVIPSNNPNPKNLIWQVIDDIGVIEYKKYDNILTYPYTIFNCFINAFSVITDVYHCHDMGALLVASVLKTIKGKKIIYDIHDDYAKLLSNVCPEPFKPLAYTLLDSFEGFLCTHFVDHILISSESLRLKAEGFGWKFMGDNHVTLIPDYLISENYTDISEHMDFENPTFVMLGNLTSDEQVKHIIDIFDELDCEHPELRGKIKLNIYGNIWDSGKILSLGKSMIATRQSKTSRIRGYDGITPNVISDISKGAMCGILLNESTPSNIVTIKNTVYEYMAMGLPVLISMFPRNKSFIAKNKCGSCVYPTDKNRIKHEILSFIRYPSWTKKAGKLGKEAIKSTYNWKICEKQLLEVYKNVLGN